MSDYEKKIRDLVAHAAKNIGYIAPELMESHLMRLSNAATRAWGDELASRMRARDERLAELEKQEPVLLARIKSLEEALDAALEAARCS